MSKAPKSSAVNSNNADKKCIWVFEANGDHARASHSKQDFCSAVSLRSLSEEMQFVKRERFKT
jgi:hypothetical protein